MPNLCSRRGANRVRARHDRLPSHAPDRPVILGCSGGQSPPNQQNGWNWEKRESNSHKAIVAGFLAECLDRLHHKLSIPGHFHEIKSVAEVISEETPISMGTVSSVRATGRSFSASGELAHRLGVKAHGDPGEFCKGSSTMTSWRYQPSQVGLCCPSLDWADNPPRHGGCCHHRRRSWRSVHSL